MDRQKYYKGTGFLDLLFNTMLCFAVLFMISFIQMAKKNKKADIEKPKAEFIITTTWQDNSDDDIDTWVKDPAGNILYFMKADTGVGIMHLDRDDLGTLIGKDSTFSKDGSYKITNPHNQEIVSIRGIMPGTWTINLQVYRKREDKYPAIVVVKLVKLNPVVKVIAERTLTLTYEGEEVTVVRFQMLPSGKAIDVDQNPPLYKMVEEQLEYTTGWGGSGEEGRVY